ncbi:MAG: hypothetical protein OEP52_08500 [Acidimicrobiia bacterium]|nr:hypothetical protein [Acidimicrobiia bacterium]
MLDRQQRELLVVPYTPPPPPRGLLILGTASFAIGGIALLGLAMADYSTATTAWLVVIATLGFLAGAVLLINGIRARQSFRQEMERAVEPTPVKPVDGRTESIEAV